MARPMLNLAEYIITIVTISSVIARPVALGRRRPRSAGACVSSRYGRTRGMQAWPLISKSYEFRRVRGRSRQLTSNAQDPLEPPSLYILTEIQMHRGHLPE